MNNDLGRALQEMADIRFLLQKPVVDRDEVRGDFARAGLGKEWDELESSI